MLSITPRGSRQCTEMENDQFSSGGFRRLELNAILCLKTPKTFIVLVLYKNLRFLRYFDQNCSKIVIFMDCFTHHNLIYMQKKPKLKFWILKVKCQKLFCFLTFLNTINVVRLCKNYIFHSISQSFQFGFQKGHNLNFQLECYWQYLFCIGELLIKITNSIHFGFFFFFKLYSKYLKNRECLHNTSSMKIFRAFRYNIAFNSSRLKPSDESVIFHLCALFR